MRNKTLLGKKKKLVFVSIVLIALICNIGIAQGFMPDLDKQDIKTFQLRATNDQLIESQEIPMNNIFDSTDVAGLIKSDIEDKQLDIVYYLKQNPDLIDEISEIIKKKISAEPELIGDFEKLTGEVELEITSYKLQSSIQISSMKTMGLGWSDLIRYILKIFLPAKPGININYIVSQCERIAIRFTVDNADTIYGVTVVSDGKIVGYVGDGWFTWPGNSKTFTVEYNDNKCHKIEAYPTILKGIREIRTIFTSFLPICINSGSYIILPEPEVVEIQPISIEVAPFPFEKGNMIEINPPVGHIIESPIYGPILAPISPIFIQEYQFK